MSVLLTLNASSCCKHACAEIRDMTKRADAEKAQETAAASAMESIEAAARKQYEADKKAAQVCGIHCACVACCSFLKVHGGMAVYLVLSYRKH